LAEGRWRKQVKSKKAKVKSVEIASACVAGLAMTEGISNIEQGILNYEVDFASSAE